MMLRENCKPAALNAAGRSKKATEHCLASISAKDAPWQT